MELEGGGQVPWESARQEHFVNMTNRVNQFENHDNHEWFKRNKRYDSPMKYVSRFIFGVCLPILMHPLLLSMPFPFAFVLSLMLLFLLLVLLAVFNLHLTSFISTCARNVLTNCHNNLSISFSLTTHKLLCIKTVYKLPCLSNNAPNLVHQLLCVSYRVQTTPTIRVQPSCPTLSNCCLRS